MIDPDDQDLTKLLLDLLKDPRYFGNEDNQSFVKEFLNDNKSLIYDGLSKNIDDKDESPYWKSSYIETSKKLLSFIGIELPVSNKEQLIIDSKKVIKNLILKINIPNINEDQIKKDLRSTLCQSLLDSHSLKWIDPTGPSESAKKPKASGKKIAIKVVTEPETFRSKSMKIYPTPEQKEILINWINDAHYVYNACIGDLVGEKEKVLGTDYRDKFVTKKDTEITDLLILRSMDRTPKDIRAKSAFEACTAHNSSLKKNWEFNPVYKDHEKALAFDEKALIAVDAKIKKKKIGLSKLLEQKSRLEVSIVSLKESLKHIPKFKSKDSKLKFRRKKDPYAYIVIPKTACTITDDNLWKIYPTSMGKKDKGIKVSEKFNAPTSEFQIRWCRRLDSWKIIVVETIKIEPKVKTNRTIVGDPGIRSFITCTDFEGSLLEIGKNWRGYKNIYEQCKKLEIYEKISLKGVRGIERFRLLKAKKDTWLRRTKLRNMIKDFHKKTINFLVTNYDVIVLPKLRTKSFLKSKGGLGSDINKDISLISHGRFHDDLTWKAMSLGKLVINQDEAYTTQTCFECGKLTKIGASKTYKCDHCLNEQDRDIQSCLNITTRYMSSYSSTV